jgi:hypothetical protein
VLLKKKWELLDFALESKRPLELSLSQYLLSSIAVSSNTTRHNLVMLLMELLLLRRKTAESLKIPFSHSQTTPIFVL